MFLEFLKAQVTRITAVAKSIHNVFYYNRLDIKLSISPLTFLIHEHGRMTTALFCAVLESFVCIGLLASYDFHAAIAYTIPVMTPRVYIIVLAVWNYVTRPSPLYSSCQKSLAYLDRTKDPSRAGMIKDMEGIDINKADTTPLLLARPHRLLPFAHSFNPLSRVPTPPLIVKSSARPPVTQNRSMSASYWAPPAPIVPIVIEAPRRRGGRGSGKNGAKDAEMVKPNGGLSRKQRRMLLIKLLMGASRACTQ
ncbi:hypothetical protein CPC08DRAFT_750145, partial [Agrocybe pediades]